MTDEEKMREGGFADSREHQKNMQECCQLLQGKKIIRATIRQIREEYDDVPYLDLILDDGSEIRIDANFGSYTGASDNEYPRFIFIYKKDKQC